MAEIDLTKMTSAELVKALIKDNLLASEFDRLNLWEEFDSDYWCELLSAQPQFADKCAEYNGWKEFNSYNWCNLLSAQSQFADKCTKYNGWEKFDSWDWSNLLSPQPQFADKCAEYKVWENFDSENGGFLLSSQPQLWIYCPEVSVNKIKEDPTKAKECKCWDWIDSENWYYLLFAQPQFANKCNWSKMRANNYDEYEDYEYGDFEDWKAEYGVDYSENWRNILLKHPQLTEYFTDVLWDGLSQEDWEVLEAQHPGVFEEKHTLSTLRKLAED